MITSLALTEDYWALPRFVQGFEIGSVFVPPPTVLSPPWAAARPSLLVALRRLLRFLPGLLVFLLLALPRLFVFLRGLLPLLLRFLVRLLPLVSPTGTPGRRRVVPDVLPLLGSHAVVPDRQRQDR